MHENQNSVGVRANANGKSGETKTSDESSSPPNKNALMKLKSYLIALRVWSLSASIIPTILGEYGMTSLEIVQGDFWVCVGMVQRNPHASENPNWISSHVIFFTSWILSFWEDVFNFYLSLMIMCNLAQTGSSCFGICCRHLLKSYACVAYPVLYF